MKMVLSFGGLVLYLGYGVGPFVVGILTEKVGWKISFYLSGSVYILLSIKYLKDYLKKTVNKIVQSG